MNRRGFLSLAAAAPVALPMAANAAAKGYASSVYLTGEIMEFESVGYTLRPNDFKPIISRRFAVDEIVTLPLSVEQQMTEHGVFDLSSSSTTTTECRRVG